MYWNYRIIRKKYIHWDGSIEYNYAIYEVYYNMDNTINYWTENPISIGGGDKDELKKDYEYYGEAFKKPVLDWKELEEELSKRNIDSKKSN